MSELNHYVKEYNSLVKEWNRKYGKKCQGMMIESINKLNQNVVQNIYEFIFSNDFSERRKIKYTVTQIGDYAKLSNKYQDNIIHRKELAVLIVNTGQKILKETSILKKI